MFFGNLGYTFLTDEKVSGYNHITRMQQRNTEKLGFVGYSTEVAMTSHVINAGDILWFAEVSSQCLMLAKKWKTIDSPKKAKL